MTTVRMIWRILLPRDRTELRWLVALMLLGMLLEALGIGLVIPVVAAMARTDIATYFPAFHWLRNWQRTGASTSFVVIAMAALVVAFLVKNLFLGILAWRETRFTRRVEVELGQRMFALYLAQPYAFHLQRNSAHLVSAINNEVGVFASFGVLPLLTAMSEALVFLALLAFTVFIEPVAMVIAGIVACVAGATLYAFTASESRRLAAVRQHHEEKVTQYLQQGFGSVKDILMLGRAEEVLARFDEHNVERGRATQRNDTLLQVPRLIVEFFAVLTMATVTVFLLSQGRSPASLLPTLAMFAAVAFRLMPSATRILSSLEALRFAGPSIDMLHRDLTTLRRLEPGAAANVAPWQTIEMRDVSFSYEAADEESLRNVSLRVRAGESIGIVGTSGAGKTTLMDVLLGLLVPTSGAVLLDGVDILPDPRPWQREIGYVPQSIYLTDDSIRRNVAFGVSDALIDDKRVWSALAEAQLDNFVRRLARDIDTTVGEQGVRLSGGERQRIGIARALYHSPHVLVFDEATSALDTNTEREIVGTISDLRRDGRTIVIVTHRHSALTACDRVYRLEAGRIIDVSIATTAAVGE